MDKNRRKSIKKAKKHEKKYKKLSMGWLGWSFSNKFKKFPPKII